MIALPPGPAQPFTRWASVPGINGQGLIPTDRVRADLACEPPPGTPNTLPVCTAVIFIRALLTLAFYPDIIFSSQFLQASTVKDSRPSTYTAFSGQGRIAAGPLPSVALAIKRAMTSGADAILIFDDSTGRPIDIDTRGTDDEVLARLARTTTSGDRSEPAAAAAADPPADLPTDAAAGTGPAGDVPRGRGRPKLGVVAREVTLLPRHWEWLGAQTGGASVALRRLVEVARLTNSAQDLRRKAQERAYHFMAAMTGDMAGFEEATRALFANDEPRLRELVAAWPSDVRGHVVALAFGTSEPGSPDAA